LVFFFFVFFVAFFSGAAVSGAGFATALGAAFRVPGARNFGDVIDPGTDPEPEHGGPPIMPHACASLMISLFAEVVTTSVQAIMPIMSTRRHAAAILISDHPTITRLYNQGENDGCEVLMNSHRTQIR
jgi:hypothetical protein